MKKLTITTLVITALCTLHNASNAMMPVVEHYKIYIENHYGAPIKFKIAQPQEAAQEISVGNMERVLVGTVYTVKKLSIRTTGAGSSYLSPFTDLAKEIQQLVQQANLDENMYRNAVIIIKPSKSYENWNIQINWEKEMSTEAMSPEEEVIAQIINGSLGSDYAEKIVALSSNSNELLYSLAQGDGGANLDDLLSARIRTLIINNEKNPTKQKYEQDLKDTIDSLYAELQRYKKRYFVKK